MIRSTDNLIDSREAGRWLSTLTRDSETACQEVATELGKAERFGPFTLERHQAILMVDKWAAPLQEELLEKYALTADTQHERGNKIAGTLGIIAQSFGRYYDALIESLRIVPRDRNYPALSYITLVRRLAHLRYEMVLVALGYENSLRWNKIHRLYRHAMQHRAREAGKPLPTGSDARTAGASAESEYIQILLTHLLANAELEAQEVLCAVGWLGHWADALAIASEPSAGNAFAIYPAGSAGLVVPPRSINTGLLWLNVTPLHLMIRQQIGEEQNNPPPDDGTTLSANRRIALLHRLLVLWRGPEGNDVRREPRRNIRKAVHVAFGLPDIALTMRLSGSGFKGPKPGDTVPPDISSTGGDTIQRWTVNDVSDSGCRLHCEAGAIAGITPGTLAAVRANGTDVWIIGIVRRRGSLSGGEADLGIQILSTHVRLLALDENADANATTAAPDGAVDPASGFVRTASGRKPALLLGAGVGAHAAIKQSVLILADDYAPGRNYYCETKRHRYKLRLKNALERHEQYVWASISVAQIGSLGRPDA